MNDEVLANSFNLVADDYDKHRTGYPPEIIEDILSLLGKSIGNLSACEIGCGTGQATKDFANYGVSVTAVEPGLNLMIRAQSNLSEFPHVRFINSKFEDVNLPERSFDLVYAAQSFHWVDRASSHRLVSHILKPGGLFAAFWKCESPVQDTLHQKLDSTYQEYITDYQPSDPLQYEQSSADDLKALLNSNLFYLCQLRRYPQPTTRQNTRSFLDSISTWSKIAALDPGTRKELLGKVHSIVEAHGGTVEGGRAEVLMICGYSGLF